MNEFEPPVLTFEDAYTENYGDLVRFAERRGARESAEDVTQEAMLRMYKASGFDYDVAAPWLKRVTYNLLVDRYRAAQVRPHEVAVEILDRTPSDATDYTEDVHNRLLAEQALAYMSEEQREVVELALMQGYSTAEVAQKLSIPEGTVKSRQYYGLRAARLAFTELNICSFD